VKNAELLCQISKRLLNDEAGATAIEYCIIAAGIGLAVFGAVELVGSSLNSIFASVATAIR
jgi:pilus assembly protein Flp/PilA